MKQQQQQQQQLQCRQQTTKLSGAARGTGCVNVSGRWKKTQQIGSGKSGKSGNASAGVNLSVNGSGNESGNANAASAAAAGAGVGRQVASAAAAAAHVVGRLTAAQQMVLQEMQQVLMMEGQTLALS
jgi:hypothetical protein